MKRYISSILSVCLFCGLNNASAADSVVKQENKSAQLYYQNGGTPNYYQQGYGYAPQYNAPQYNVPVRPVSSQLCIPGIGCGTFLPRMNTQVNPFSNVNCGPNGCYLNQQVPSNQGCTNGQCGNNPGFYNYNRGPQLGTFPVVPAPTNYGYPANNGYPMDGYSNGVQYNQPAYPPQFNNYGVQYIPAPPVRTTPVSPYNYIVQGNDQATKTNTATTTNSNLQANKVNASPYFE